MKILVVSSKGYSISNRGVDNMTSYLSQRYKVDHLLFYVRENKKPVKISEKLTQIYFQDKLKFYRDKFKYFLPGCILKRYFVKMIQTNNNICFSSYDYIILESGYPVYLALVLNNPLIYRQSDPPEIAFNSNRKFYHKLEDNLIKKSIVVSSALEPSFYPKEYKNKYVFWKTGYISQSFHCSYSKKKQFSYMGGMQLDYQLLRQIAIHFPNYTIYIIGPHKDKVGLKNVVFTGYLDYKKYEPLIAESSAFIIPIARKYVHKLKKASITSKFYLPMSLGIPIIVRAYGILTENDFDKKIYVYKNNNEAIRVLSDFVVLFDNNEYDYSLSTNTLEYIKRQSFEEKAIQLGAFFKEYIV